MYNLKLVSKDSDKRPDILLAPKERVLGSSKGEFMVYDVYASDQASIDTLINSSPSGEKGFKPPENFGLRIDLPTFRRKPDQRPDPSYYVHEAQVAGPANISFGGRVYPELMGEQN